MTHRFWKAQICINSTKTNVNTSIQFHWIPITCFLIDVFVSAYAMSVGTGFLTWSGSFRWSATWMFNCLLRKNGNWVSEKKSLILNFFCSEKEISKGREDAIEIANEVKKIQGNIAEFKWSEKAKSQGRLRFPKSGIF